MAELAFARRAVPGVLFAEDFDAPAMTVAPAAPAASIVEAERPRFSQIEYDDAIAIARAAGLDAGRVEALATGELCRRDTVAAVRSGLDAMRDEASRVLDAELGRVADLAIAVMLALVPSIAAERAHAELRPLLATVIAGLIEPERMTVSVHPDLVRFVGRELDAIERPDGLAVQVLADPRCGPVDLRARWTGGGAERRLADAISAMERSLRGAGLLNNPVSEQSDDDRSGS